MSKLINDLIAQFVVPEYRWRITLLSAWPTIMGPFANRTSIMKIEHGILTIGVTDSCLMQELYLLSELLCDRINQSLDQPRIKQLRFKMTQMNKGEKITMQPATTISPSAAPSKKELDALQYIQDVELKRALHQYLIRCYGERR